MNSVQLVGRLGKDPERKGDKVVTFTMATTEYYKGEEKTQWHTVKVFSGTADFAEKHFKKGDPIEVVGSIEYSEYEGKWYTSIKANNVGFVPKVSGDTQPARVADDELFDDDIPFN